MRCEDYPCCGHEVGDCPDSQGRMKCVNCGKRLPKNAPSSLCERKSCQRSFEKRMELEERGYFFDEGY